MFRTCLDGLVELALPTWCPGCGAEGEALCAACRAQWSVPPRRVSPSLTARCAGQAPPVWSGPDYTGAVARTLVAWKERGRLDLTPLLGEVLARVVDQALHAIGACPVHRRSVASGGLLLVPLPSARAAVRRRGEDVVGSLARAAAAALRQTPPAGGAGLRAACLLRQRRGVVDQAGLSARERGRNMARGLRVTPSAQRLLDGRGVIIVDDVVTTGATSSEAVRVFDSYGAYVAAICTVTTTPRRGALAAPVSLD